MPRSASCATWINGEQFPIVPAASPLLLLDSLGLISSAAAAKLSLLTSLRPPWSMVSLVRSLLHQSPHDQPSPRANRAVPSDHLANTGFSRTLGRRSSYCADSTRHRCDHTSSTVAWFTPIQMHPVISARQPLLNRVNRVCRAILAPRLGANRSVTPLSGIFFSEVPRSSSTMISFIWRLTNTIHRRNPALDQIKGVSTHITTSSSCLSGR